MAGTVKPEEIVALDPEARTFQSVPVGQPGGVICLYVVETVPGTRTEWRELVVSELRAMGRPGAARRDLRYPIDVSDFRLAPPFVTRDDPGLRRAFAEGAEVELSTDEVESLRDQPYRSIESLCAAYVRMWRSRVQSSKDSHWPGNDRFVACRELPLPLPLSTRGAPFVGARAIEGKTGWSARRYIVGETKEGLWLTPIVYAESHDMDDDSRVLWEHQALLELRVESGNLVLVEAFLSVSSSLGEYRIEPAIVRGASWCSVAGGRLACKQWHPTFAPPLGIKRKEGERDASVVAALPWADLIPFAIDASGKLRRR
jgi:hypothetical protein